MRLKITKSAKSTRLYAIKSTYDPRTKKTSSKIAAKLGTAEEVMEREGLDYDGALAWARAEIARMTEEEAADAATVTVRLRPAKRIEKDARRSANAGYLFPAKVLSELGLRGICDGIAEDAGFGFDLGEIAEHLVVGRMLAPSSKLATFGRCQELVGQPSFSAHQACRALSVLAESSDAVQAGLYRASAKLRARRTGVLYYDCTNYFFEVDAADEGGDRQHGVSKERGPSPTVQMGLFMDADGIPLAFRIAPGNQSERTTPRPLEQTIMDEFGESRFVVCADAGLSPEDNRLFNTRGGRAFVTVQSIERMGAELREWALDRAGWMLPGSEGPYDLREVGEAESWERVFYKERWAKDDDGFEQRYVATFSFKRMERQASIREQQAERAAAEAAEEARYDGFSCIATSLEDEPADIIAVSKRRWQVEECFRIMKAEFKARPVCLGREDRIRGHFLTCFIALLVYRLMDERLGHALTRERLLSTLRGMDMLELPGEGWVPAYTRDDATDALHEAFGFHTDYEIVTNRQMGKVLTAAHSPKVRSTK